MSENPPNFPAYPAAPGGAPKPPPPADFPSYSGMPQSAPVYAPVPVRTPAPSSVRNAKLLLLAIAGLGILDLIVALASTDAMREQLADSELTAAEVDAALAVGLVFAGIMAVVIAGLYVLLAFKVGQGRPWARIVVVVFNSIGILFGLSGLTQGGLALVVTVLTMLLYIAVIVLLFQRPSNEYFAQPRELR